MYGSGYPGVNGPGVSGRGFPYVYWPVVWPLTRLVTHNTIYLYNTEVRPCASGVFFPTISQRNYSYLCGQYGEPSNTARPGGVLFQAAFVSNNSSSGTSSIFHVISDNSTVTSLVSSIHANCSVSPQSPPSALDGSASDPLPEQAIEYYRASSVVLTLDGYTNAAALSNEPDATPTPLPLGVNMTFLNCLNYTIGEAVPLISTATRAGTSNGDASLRVPHSLFLAAVCIAWLLS